MAVAAGVLRRLVRGRAAAGLGHRALILCDAHAEEAAQAVWFALMQGSGAAGGGGGMDAMQSTLSCLAPTETQIAESVRFAQHVGASSIVTVGTGTALDVGKAVATCMATKLPVAQLLSTRASATAEDARRESEALPGERKRCPTVIHVPTTDGPLGFGLPATLSARTLVVDEDEGILVPLRRTQALEQDDKLQVLWPHEEEDEAEAAQGGAAKAQKQSNNTAEDKVYAVCRSLGTFPLFFDMALAAVEPEAPSAAHPTLFAQGVFAEGMRHMWGLLAGGSSSNNNSNNITKSTKTKVKRRVNDAQAAAAILAAARMHPQLHRARGGQAPNGNASSLMQALAGAILPSIGGQCSAVAHAILIRLLQHHAQRANGSGVYGTRIRAALQLMCDASGGPASPDAVLDYLPAPDAGILTLDKEVPVGKVVENLWALVDQDQSMAQALLYELEMEPGGVSGLVSSIVETP